MRIAVALSMCIAGSAYGGSFSALSPSGAENDEVLSFIYDPTFGNVIIDPPNDTPHLNTVSISSEAGVFTGPTPGVLRDESAVHLHTDTSIFKSCTPSDCVEFGRLDLGPIATPQLTEALLLQDITLTASASRIEADLLPADLIYIPEPTSGLLMLIGTYLLLPATRQPGAWRRPD